MKIAKRLECNEQLENEMHSLQGGKGHINGQNLGPVAKMRFGAVSAGFASCELIAVYNVLNDLGIHRRLSSIFYDAEKAGYLLLKGVFGTKIGSIGKLLEKYGVKSKKIKAKEFIELAKNRRIRDGAIYIITIRNNRLLPISPLHTFESVFENGKWTVYNRFSNLNGTSVYTELDDILSNGRSRGAIYSVYEIMEKL